MQHTAKALDWIMVDLTHRAQMLALLDELGELSEKLTPNELEMFAHLREKYAAPDQGDFDDKICLEVMIRNVSIRAGYGMDKSEATRVVDFINAKDDKE